MKTDRSLTYLVGVGLTIFGIVLSLIIAFCLQFIEIKSSEKLILIDAGSSSTRSYAYEFGSFDRLKRPIQISGSRCGDSIHKVIDNPQKLKELLEGCIRPFLENEFHKISTNKISFYLGATGGMRDRCILEPVLCDNFGLTIKNVVKQIGLNIKTTDSQVITGTMEALLGWIAVNDKFDNFQDNVNFLGAIDLGGSSLETAYLLGEDIIKLSPNNQKIELAFIDRADYHVVSTILDCYGQDQVLRIFNTFIYNEQKDSALPNNNFQNPCMPNTYSFSYIVKDMNNACTSQYITKFNITNNYNIVGGQNLDQCFEYLNKFFGSKSSCNQDYKCDFVGNNYVRPNVVFLAFSSYYYFGNDLGLKNEENLLDLYRDRLEERCFVNPQSSTFKVDKYCGGMAYGYHILKNGFKVTNSNLKIYESEDSLSWVQGKSFFIKSTTELDEKAYINLKVGLFAGLILSISITLIGFLIVLNYFYDGKDNSTQASKKKNQQ